MLPCQWQHGRVELFGTGPRLAPLEVADCVRAHCQMQHRVADELTWLLAGVDLAPIDCGGGLLHEEPGLLP